MARFSRTSSRSFCLAGGLALVMTLVVAATRGDDSPPATAPDVPAKKAPIARPAIKPLIRLNIRPVAPATGKEVAPAVAVPAEPAPPEDAPEVRRRFHGLAQGGPSRLSHMSL